MNYILIFILYDDRMEIKYTLIQNKLLISVLWKKEIWEKLHIVYYFKYDNKS